MSLPLVAIVGAPNVGKSTLFNRLVGRRQAIVTDQPGMTRDRLYGEVDKISRPFRLVDTGGMTPRTEAPFAREIEQQAETALEEADVILFVVDARAGATALELELASMLRQRSQPLILLANKVDTPKQDAQVHELHRLGMGEPVPISAEHGVGVEVLLDMLEELLPEVEIPSGEPGRVDVAIVGRPNVGKSSILNRLVGADRVMVSDIPGTTRDAIDTLLDLGERRYRLIDTAGIRRPGRIREVPEIYSVKRARQNIERCDVAILVLDATEELAAQDAHIAGYIVDAYKPLVVVVNKWDLVDGREEAVKAWEERVRYRLKFAKLVPVIFVSALSGQRVTKILDRVDTVHECAGIRVATTELNRWLRIRGPRAPFDPPRGTGLRLFYATQKGVHPPSFVMFCNDPRQVHFSLRRQLENALRDQFGFGAAPIRLQFRARRPARTG